MVASLSALNALSIDIMLPALPQMAQHFGLANDNDRQLIVISYVALFGVSQLFYGPLADAFGRRSVLVYALGIYIAGSVLCVVAPSFELFLAARCMQGVGAAATRVVATAVVRDLTEGRRMAQVMSMAMTLFMVVPIIAPGIGQLILFIAPWKWIFATLLIYSVIVLAWMLLRLPETLRPENRTPFKPDAIAGAYASVFRQRQTIGYMIATTFITGCLFGYITSSEQLFVDVYHLGPAFPIAFASIAVAISCGTFLNSRLVIKHGMRRISHTMIIGLTMSATALAILAQLGLASFWVFTGLLAFTFAMFGLIASNFNALAMEPVGRIAGSASAVFGAVTASGGSIIGAFIGRAFDGTPAPFATGLAISGVATLLAVLWTERGKLFKVGAQVVQTR